MKGWIYVITNQAVRGLVRVGVTPKDPVAFAEALDKGACRSRMRSGMKHSYRTWTPQTRL